MSSLLNADYDSSSDDGAKSSVPKTTPATNIVAAPEVSIEVWSPTPYPVYISALSLDGKLKL